MFYDLYCALCKQKNVKPTRAAIEIGLSKGLPSTWKKSGTTPQREQLIKIAEYFEVSVDYLLGKEKSPAIKDDDEAQISDEVLELAKIISDLPEDKKKTMLDLIDLLRDGAEKP